MQSLTQPQGSQLTLDDFRALLGKVNDGNVVLKEGGTGLEKAGHGNALTRLLHNYRPMPTGEAQKQQNAQIRQMLMAAIGNSQEGKALCQKQLDYIRAGLGLGRQGQEDSECDLSRYELKIVLDTLDEMVATDAQTPGADLKGRVIRSATPRKDGDLMVDRQVRLLKQGGVSSVFGTYGKDSKDIVAWAVERAKEGLGKLKALSTAEDMVKALPANLNGFPKAALAKFVTRNFALVRAHAFDQMVWQQFDGLATKRKLVKLDGKDVLVATLRRMMLDYGRDREPSLRTEQLLAEPPQPQAMTGDSSVKVSYDDFSDKLTNRLAVLFPSAPKASVKSQQLERLVGCFRTYALDAFRKSLSESNGTPLERQDAAMKSMDTLLPSFFALSVEEMKALMENEEFRTAVSDTLGKKLEQADVRDGKLSDVGILRVFNEAFNEIVKSLDPRPLAEAHVRSLHLPDDQFESAVNDLVTKLRQAKGEQLKLVTELRLGLRTAWVDGREELAAKQAQVLIENTVFRALASEALADYVSDEKVQEQRKALLQQLGQATKSGGNTYSNEFVMTYDQVVEDLEEKIRKGAREQVQSKHKDAHKITNPDLWKAYYEENKKQIKDEVDAFAAKKIEAYHKDNKGFLESVKTLTTDKEFLGKVTLLATMNLFSPEEKNGLFTTMNKFIFSPKTLKDDLATVDRLMAEVSLKDLKDYCTYISTGFAAGDNTLKVSPQYAGQKPLLKVVQDGTLDFAGMHPDVRELMKSILVGTGIHDTNIPGLPLEMSVVPQSLLSKVVYTQLRDAAKAQAEGKKLQGDALMNYLGNNGLRSETLPKDAEQSESFAKLSSFFSKEFGNMSGFGTFDPHQIVNLLAQVGIHAEDLKTEVGFMPLLTLQNLVTAHGGKTDGVVEWAERVTGKAFGGITLADCLPLLNAQRNGSPIPDPLDKIQDRARTCVEFLGGSLQPSKAGLDPEEMPAFLKALRELSEGKQSSGPIRLFGEQVKLERTGSGGVKARFADRNDLPFPVMRSIGEMTMLVENEIAWNVKRYGSEAVKEILPKLPGPTGLIARAREFYSKALSGLLDMPSVNFAHLSTQELYDTVQRALDNPDSVRDRFATPPTKFINAEAIELQAKFLKADGVTRALVKLPSSPSAKSFGQRQTEPPTKAEVHDFIADLVMNKDAWAFDAGNQVPGTRLMALAESHAPELQHILSNDQSLLKTLPTAVREPLTAFLNKLAQVAAQKPLVVERFAPLEADLDVIVKKAMTDLQKKASDLFPARGGDNQELWQKGLADMTGLDGLDQSTAEGRFTKRILDTYFTHCDQLEQRSMLAAFIRNVDEKSTDGEQVAEALKGAGPLLQKMLQGLPSNTFGPETQKALADMKSNLLPIPDSVIQAHLLELVRSSNGEILSVDVQGSIGQATVGQALLCHIRTKDHPVTGEDVVIKLLRPNVQTAVQREHKLFMEIAKELDGAGDGQQRTFEGRYKSILKELDFTFESENIDVGRGAYEKPSVTRTNGVDPKPKRTTYDDVHSMDRHHGVAPMTAMIVLQKVEGRPVDRLMKDVSKRSDEILGTLTRVDSGLEGEPTVTTYQTDSPEKLLRAQVDLGLLREKLVTQRQGVVKLLDAWIERALFNDGVFHNDLHPGNVMVDGKNVTVIDFGNVMRLETNERNQLIFMFLAATQGNADGFLKALEKLLPPKSLNVVKTALTGELKTVFSKGTAEDVLPRFLAAMSILQHKGLPVPEAVYNFAQSLLRLKGVLGAFDGGIAEIERKSASISFTADFAKESKAVGKFAGENDGNPEGASLDVVDRLIAGLLGPEDPDGKLSILNVRDHFELLYKEFPKGEIDKTLNGLDDSVSDDQKTPLRQTCEDIRNKVFTQEDGGIGYLRAVADLLGKFVRPSVRGGSEALSECTVELISLAEQEAFANALAEYQADLNAVASGEANRLAKGQRKVLCAFMNLLCDCVAHFHNREDRLKYLWRPHVSTPSLEECVGESINSRQDAFVDILRVGMGIPEEKFKNVMKLADEGAGMWRLGFEAGGDSLKFNTLKNIKEGLETASTNAQEHRSKLEKARTAANNAVPKEVPIAPERREKIFACAKDARMPVGWTPSLAKETGKVLFTSVLSANLTVLRAALAPETLTDADLAYYARIFSVATEKVGLQTFVRDNVAAVDQLKATLNQSVANQDPGADGDVVRLLDKLSNQQMAA